MNKNKNSFFKSVIHALNGILYGIKHERNVKIHFVAGAFISLLGILFQLQRWEWVSLILTMGLVISLELLNTAVEAVVDLVTDEYKTLAKVAKDVAAGAVLIATLIAILNGILLFGPKLLEFL